MFNLSRRDVFKLAACSLSLSRILVLPPPIDLQRLNDLIMLDVLDYFHIDGKLKDLRELTEEQKRLVKDVEIGPEGDVTYSFFDKDEILRLFVTYS